MATTEDFILAELKHMRNENSTIDKKLNDLGDTLKQLIAVDIEIREIKESNKRIWKAIENQQIISDTFNRFITNHDAELKPNIKTLSNHETRIGNLEKKPVEKMDKIFTVVTILLVTTVFNIVMMKIGAK